MLTNINFLLTISIDCQVQSLWKLIKWSWREKSLIFYQILSTNFLRKCMKISLENLYVDIAVWRVKEVCMLCGLGESWLYSIVLYCFYWWLPECKDIACLPPMWPWFEFRCCRQLWVEFLVGALLCSKGFLWVSGFPSLRHRWNLTLVKSVCKTALKSLFWAPTFLSGF